MLQPIDNGDYLNEKIEKYSTIGDYEIQNGDIVALYSEQVAPDKFIAKYQFIELCKNLRVLAARGIKYPVRIIREANAEDGNMFPGYDPSRQEKRFAMVIILGECDERALDMLRDGEGAMKEHEIVPGGVYRKNNA